MDINTINEQLDLLENTKGNIKQTLINKGKDIDDSMPFSEYANEINDLTDTTDATAQANEIAKGKIAYVNGTKLTGTVPVYNSTSNIYYVPADIHQSMPQEQIICNNNLDASCTSVILSDGAIIDLNDLPVDVHNANIVIWHAISKETSISTNYVHAYVLGIAPSATDNFVVDNINYEMGCRKEDKSSTVSAQYYRITKTSASSDYIALDNTFTVTGPSAGYGWVARHSPAMLGYYSTTILYSGTNVLSDTYIQYRGSSENYQYCQFVNVGYDYPHMIGFQANVATPLNNSKLASAFDVTAGKIKSGETILGVTGTYSDAMKEYASETAMNNDISNISEGEVVKVVDNNVTTFYVKETTMKKLVKEEDTLSPSDYQQSEDLVSDILS